jgi:hypothetical protein
MWITTDALGRVHIRSGQGLSRDWPRNLLANPRAVHMSTGGTSLSGRGTSPIVRSFARVTTRSRRNMAGSYQPLKQPGLPMVERVGCASLTARRIVTPGSAFELYMGACPLTIPRPSLP